MSEIASVKESCFSSDHQYLEAYIEICRLLNERYEILEDTSRRWQVPPKEKEDRERAIARLKELNQAIQDGEWFFWEKVAFSKNRGMSFLFEELASCHCLSHIEKRIALFFLCSRLSKAYDFSLNKFWIIEVFDIENSIAKKMSSLAIFDEDKPLMKSGILLTTKNGIGMIMTLSINLIQSFLISSAKSLKGLRFSGRMLERMPKRNPRPRISALSKTLIIRLMMLSCRTHLKSKCGSFLLPTITAP